MVQLFSTQARDKYTSLFVLEATDKFVVIDVNQIERGVHLMPKYGSSFSATAASREIGKNGDAFKYFKTFWLNSFIDIHMYNTIY